MHHKVKAKACNLQRPKNIKSIMEPVQFSHSVMSDSLQPHGLQHAMFPCPSNSQSLLKLMSIESLMPSNHLILSSPSPPIFPSIRVFSHESILHIRWPKYWSFSFNVSPLGWTGWISLLSKGLSRVFSNTTVQKHQFFDTQLSL